jgi:hypothetical protein
MQERLTELHDEMFAERRMLMDGRAGSVNRKKGVGDADVQDCDARRGGNRWRRGNVR